MIPSPVLKDIAAMLELVTTPQPPDKSIIVDRAAKKLARNYAPMMLDEILEHRSVTSPSYPPRFVSAIKGMLDVAQERSDVTAAICPKCGREVTVAAITPGDDRILNAMSIVREAEDARKRGDESGTKVGGRRGRPKKEKGGVAGSEGAVRGTEGKPNTESAD